MRLTIVIKTVLLMLTLTLTSCSAHHAAAPTAREICHRHFPATTVAVDLHAADVRFVGGPRPTKGVISPFDSVPDLARVVRCLVPTSSDSADVQDVLVSSDQSFHRWTQSGSAVMVREFSPPS